MGNWKIENCRKCLQKENDKVDDDGILQRVLKDYM